MPVGGGFTHLHCSRFISLFFFFFADARSAGRYFSWGRAPELLEFLIVCITIVVVAVPEGLPLAVTICLAYSVSAMTKDNNLVRTLAACEVMGGATNICSDKTGTLTQNKMTVVTGMVAETKWAEGTAVPKEQLPPHALELLIEHLSINNGAELKETKGVMTFVGNPTDCALLILVRNLGTDYKVVAHAAKDQNRIVQVYPFKSAKKRMSTVLRVNTPAGERFRLHCKGASEMVLSRCTQIMQADGSVVPLTEAKIEELKAFISGMANNALRTIAIAYRETTEELSWAEMMNNPPDEQLVLISIVGILDPLRPEVVDAVRLCKNAGIMVRMVTGDNIDTAKKIAEQCGIYDKEHGLALEGPAFARLSPAELDAILPRLQVLARSSPTDKHTLVKRLRKNNQIVAVTVC